MNNYEFDIAISFAGEDRAIAEEIASALKQKGVTIFYDTDHQANLWGKDLYAHLTEIYSEKARFCLMLISQHYLRKNWTRLERQSAQARAFRENQEYILPVRLDDTEIPGVLETIGYIDLRTVSIGQIVALTLEKLKRIAEQPDSAAAISPLSQGGFNIPIPKIKREFTDRERSQFLRQSFMLIRDYFKRGLEQLAASDTEIKADFEMITARKFAAEIYWRGTLKATCEAWWGSGQMSSRWQAINFTHSSSLHRSGITESLSVQNDDQSLYLSGFNSITAHSQRAKNGLTQQEAAEHLWQMFTSSLKY